MVTLDLETLTTKQSKTAFDAQALLDLAKKEGRGLTTEEEEQHKAFVKAIEDTGKQIARLKSDDAILDKLDEITQGASRSVPVRFAQVKSIGTQVIEDKAFKAWLRDRSSRSSRLWESPVVEVKAALVEDGLVAPDARPGIWSPPPPRGRVIDLFAQGTTNSNAVSMLIEEGFTNAAAPVAEGTLKPESTLDLGRPTELVRKIAHHIGVSDEFLEDEPQLASYIDARLREGVRRKLDDQLLNGTGVAPQLLGILARPGLAAPIVRTDPETNIDAIGKQIGAIEASTDVPVDGIVLNPSNWTTIALLKTTEGNYIAGDPFSAGPVPMLFGRPVVTTNKIVLGTGLVGSFRSAAMVFLRGGINVQATNAHSDWFTLNKVAVRGEIRAALVVMSAAAFGTCTMLT